MQALKVLALLMGLDQVKAGWEIGSCPSVTPMSSLDLSQYAGLWYEYMRDNSFVTGWFSACTTATYTARSDGDITVFNRAYYYPFSFVDFGVKGIASCENGGGTCRVAFNSLD